MASEMLIRLLLFGLLSGVGLASLNDNEQTILRTVFDTQAKQFHQQAKTEQNQTQFAVMTFTDTSELTDIQYQIRRRDDTGAWVRHKCVSTNKENQCFPIEATEAINYMVARPSDSKTIHAEETLVNSNVVNTMWNNYNNEFNKKPEWVLLFSWLIPCSDKKNNNNCRNTIKAAFTREPLKATRRVIAFNKDSRDPQQVEQFRTMMTQVGIEVMGPLKIDVKQRNNNIMRKTVIRADDL